MFITRYIFVAIEYVTANFYYIFFNFGCNRKEQKYIKYRKKLFFTRLTTCIIFVN